MTWLVVHVRQWLCGVRGHDALLRFEARRVRLCCANCGYDSPGWVIGDRAPRVRYEGDPRRHALGRRMQVVPRRRSA